MDCTSEFLKRKKTFNAATRQSKGATENKEFRRDRRGGKHHKISKATVKRINARHWET